MLKLSGWILPAVVSVVSVVTVWVMVGRDIVYSNFDGPYYVVVAKLGYDQQLIRQTFSFPLPVEYYAAHLPGYPLLIRLLASLGLVNYLDAMLVVNLIATVAVTWVLWKINVHYKWFKTPWLLPMLWLFIWPRMWAVRAVGSPETLFVLFVLISLWMFDLKKYWVAGLAGAAAVLTKSPGILLLVAYSSWFIAEKIKNKKWHVEIWPVLLMVVAGVGLFGWYQYQTGDFWAYFHSGDNIHLMLWPFGVFDANLPWVNSFWLEDVMWIYVIGGLGVVVAWRKNRVFGLFGIIYFLSILFVAHRDISRYSLPIVPMVLIGFAELLDRKEVKIILALLLVPAYLYTVNFILHNYEQIANWGPLL